MPGSRWPRSSRDDALSARLLLGPLLRHVGERDATVWVETDGPAEVEVCDHRARTFEVEGHHYALACIDGLEPASTRAYSVRLDGEHAWPEPDDPFPAPEIHTLGAGEPLRVSFGSCRVSVPCEAPYTATKDSDDRGREHDALRALAMRLLEDAGERRPHLLMLLGDQVYADEVSPGTREFIRSRRDPAVPPGETVADFEEYTHLYLDGWREPVVRWLLSTVPTAMIFDDHDVHDDWNISRDWVTAIRGAGWWDERITGGFMSYWLYQHLGNLGPGELAADPLFAQVRAMTGDAGPLLREFAFRADRENAGTRWSYHRDLGRTRVVVMDSRAGRVLDPERRRMVDEEEWGWIVDQVTGDFDHLLLGTSLPAFLAPAMHHLEAWNEAVCEGAWGEVAAGVGERLRRGLDLEHWAAFGESFARLGDLLEEIATGRRGCVPASIVVLSGDVHHAYLAEIGFRTEENGAVPAGPGGGIPGARAPVYQAVCSPLRNPLDNRERSVIRTLCRVPVARALRRLAASAGVEAPDVGWRLVAGGPWFDNQIATLDLDGRRAKLRIERVPADDERRLEHVLERALC